MSSKHTQYTLKTHFAEFRKSVVEPSRLTYALGRADAYARQAGDEMVSDLIRKIAKCIVVDDGGVIQRRLLQELDDSPEGKR